MQTNSKGAGDLAFAHIPIEKVKDFWNKRPCNLKHSAKPIGTREYFDEVEQRKYFVEPHIPGFAEFERWKGKRILEIGCGLGTDTINFARHGAQVTAIDLSEESLKLARQRAQVFGLGDSIRFHQGDAESLAQLVPAQKFDLVYSFGVIHHTPEPAKVIAHLPTYMHASSELRIMLYSRVSYKLFQMMHFEGPWDMSKIDQVISENSEAQFGCPVTYTYSYDSARELLTGFEILDMHKDHIFTWDIPNYKEYRYVKDQVWRDVSEEELNNLAKELGWHLLIRAKLACA